jgi:tagatose 6-phosphate kinase
VILTVTLNPAIDVTYYLDVLVRHSGLRVDRVLERAGGKGVNVARVAAACGAQVCATGLAGGRRGDQLRADLAGEGIREEFCPVGGETRQTVNIVETGRAGLPTELREPGPAVTQAEWDRFLDRFRSLAAEAEVVTMSGSLPPGVPASAYATLTAAARTVSTAQVIVDTGGEALRLACAAGADLVKPNENELLATAQISGGLVSGGLVSGGQTSGGQRRLDRVLAGASTLRDLGATAVVVSLGRSGSVAVSPAGRWRASHDAVSGGNPVGAGDALVAGLALGNPALGNPALGNPALGNPALGSQVPGSRVPGSQVPSWPAALKQASGLAMASVLAASAGELDPVAARRFAASVRIREIRGA